MRWISCLSLALFLSHPVQAAEPTPLTFEPGKPLRYRIERVLTGTVKVLGETQKTDEKWIMDVEVTPSAPDDQGRIKLTIHATHVEGSTPVIEGLSSRQVEFDDTKWREAAPVPASLFLPCLAMKKHPLELFYEPGGKLAATGGLKPLATTVDAMLTKDFQSQPDFPNTRILFQLMFTDGLHKTIWDDLLIVDLPQQFEPGVEWKEKKLTYIQPFYAWLQGTHLAEEGAGGSLDIESTYKVPPGKPANIKFGNQDYDYTVKNGEGTGKFKLDADGKVRELDTTWHVYFDVTLNAGGTRIPFDEFYQRLKYKIQRKE
jgi:hypothetical protein